MGLLLGPGGSWHTRDTKSEKLSWPGPGCPDPFSWYLWAAALGLGLAWCSAGL